MAKCGIGEIRLRGRFLLRGEGDGVVESVHYRKILVGGKRPSR